MKTALLFILGMHRSGTSALTGMLQEHGIYLGENFNKENKFNRKGNREDKRVVQINNDILKLNGGSWHAPSESNSIDDSVMKRINDYAQQFNSNHDLMGIKDPRMLFCLEAWTSHVEPRYIGIFRNPIAVVRSLKSRNFPNIADKNDEEWLELWRLYNLRLLHLVERHQFDLINFDWPDEKLKYTVKKSAINLGLNGLSSNEFYESRIRTEDKPNQHKSLEEPYEELYAQLTRRAELTYNKYSRK